MPFLCAAWFGNTGATELEKKDNVEKAQALFTHVAHTYHQDMISKASNLPLPHLHQSQTSSADNITNSWLRDICNVNLAELISTPNTLSEDQVTDEVKRYFKFEGGPGDIQHPLAWWKVPFIIL